MDPLTRFLETVRNMPAEKVADALRELHARRPNETGPPVSPQAYDDARRFFVDVEKRRQQERTTAETMLARLQARDASLPARTRELPAQQTVHVTTLPAAIAGARFVVHNPHRRSLQMRFESGRATRGGAPLAGVAVTLSPEHVDLAAGGRCTVCARVDLRKAGVVHGDQVEIAVDARAGGRTAMKIWLEVDVIAAESHE